MNKVIELPGRDATVFKERRPPDWGGAGRGSEHREVLESWEAPAGSGKTGLLIQRYLKLLGQANVTDPRQVLAITFTRKATEEIRERVMEHLEAAAQDAPLKSNGGFERETRRLAEAVLLRDEALEWKLRENPRRLAIRSIDSVCQEIARSLPVLSGSGGGLTPTKNAELLHRKAARRTLMQLGGKDAVLHESLATLLLHRDGSLTDCERPDRRNAGMARAVGGVRSSA